MAASSQTWCGKPLSDVFVGFAALAAYFFNSRTQKGFLPEEDQGAFFIELRLPEGHVARTTGAAEKVESIVRGWKASKT